MSWSDPCSNCGQHRADCDCGDYNGYKKNNFFICQGCKHELPLNFCMKTEGYCYLCDPNITVEELLKEEK